MSIKQWKNSPRDPCNLHDVIIRKSPKRNTVGSNRSTRFSNLLTSSKEDYFRSVWWKIVETGTLGNPRWLQRPVLITHTKLIIFLFLTSRTQHLAQVPPPLTQNESGEYSRIARTKTEPNNSSTTNMGNSALNTAHKTKDYVANIEKK